MAALLLSTSLATATSVSAQVPATDPLASEFRAPPASARPRVWWHWMNGNVTQDGIAKDLDWMKRVGIGGLQMFDANIMTPQIVPNRLAYMTPGWKDAFRFAATKADQLDLELAIAASPGWSETGGPWVKPEDGIKKFTWSETIVRGGRRFTGSLPRPSAATGPFLDVPAESPPGAPPGGERPQPPQYYADIAVIAYRASHAGSADLEPHMSIAGHQLATSKVRDGSYASSIDTPRPTADEPTRIDLTFDRPPTVRSASIFVHGGGGSYGTGPILAWLEASEDGAVWRKVVDLPLTAVPTTASFAPVSARNFRVVLAQPPAGESPLSAAAPGADVAPFASLAAPTRFLQLAELRLSSEKRINRFEAKAGFALAADYYDLDGAVDPDGAGVPQADVIDLSDRMQPNGALDWTAPPGNWRVLRMGYSLTGKTNHPAADEATGLEVDKLDSAAVRRYLDTYIGMYRDAVGPELFGGRGVKALLTDSTEVGAFNWTPRLLEQFERLRGYDARPWLPTLTGVIIQSRAESDKFLYDFRRTIGELHATEHYGTVAKVAHGHGLKVYGEALESGRVSLGDDIDMRRFADYPMAALWTYGRGSAPQPAALSDLRGAASTAHVFGGNIVAAESLTSVLQPWAHAPGDLRRIIDLEFASGINRPVIHTSVHQPTDDNRPGLSLMIFGQFFNRHETWAEMARPWIDYIARTSHLLQQGRFFADVAYFYGEEAPTISLTRGGPLTDVPTRYAYDFINPTALNTVLTMDGGELSTPGGARYRVLYLGGTSRRMTLPTLRKVAALAERGATIVGLAPESSPARDEDTAEYRALVARLWPGGEVTRVGSGQVIASRDVEAALARVGVTPDFDVRKPEADSEVLFVHRRLPQGDLYFVNNRKNRRQGFEARFRVTGRMPEIWRAATGTAEPVSFRTEGDVTVVPLDLEAEESVFVVFREPTAERGRTVSTPSYQALAQLDGAWKVRFQSGRGAPEEIETEGLRSLSDHSAPGVKYFSGVATYSKRFVLPKTLRPGAPVLLDLGAVGDLAEVTVNGKAVGVAWQAPYRVDIGSAVKRGENTLEVKVANLWVNRLIGDAQPGAKKVGFVTIPTYTAAAPLRPSGLMGPVVLMSPVERPAGRRTRR